MLPLEAFPPSFQADVARWEERMRQPDLIFDFVVPQAALREATLQSYRFMFRRIASALVRAGTVKVEEITGLEVFFQAKNFETGLREYLPAVDSGRTRDYASKMASQLVVVASDHLGFGEAQLKPIKHLVGRLKSKEGQGSRHMGQRNRKRLEQFDDAEVVQRLLRFPEEELGRALRMSNLVRRAKGIERALAVSIAIFTGLRVKNLRSLNLETNFRRSGTRVFIHVSEEEIRLVGPSTSNCQERQFLCFISS